MNQINRLVSLGIFALCLCGVLTSPTRLSSANLTTVKDTLSSSRLSFHGRINSTGTTAGSSTVTLQTSAGTDTASSQANSISTAPLKAGDTLTIGSSAPGAYTVVSIFSSSVFTVSPVLASGDADNNDPVYLNLKPVHTVTFTTATAVANGFFQILLPADATTPNDGKADDQGFDFGAGTVTVAAVDVDSPGGGAVEYDFDTPVATIAGNAGCTAPANYHCFEVHYSGTGSVGAAITVTIGSGANTPIAPASGTAHTEATADTYTYLVKNFAAGSDPNSATPTDSTTGKVAVIESVRVSATVDPTISFSISGVASGVNACGTGATNATDVSTAAGTNAPLAVAFGTLSNLNTFYDAAHTLTVSTNAANGYVVTAQENDQLNKDGTNTAVFIPDVSGDNGTASETVTDTWDVASAHPGFGYTLKTGTGSPTVPFTSTGATFNARRFPSVADPDAPLVQTIMSQSTIANADTANVCYRISVAATQAAGDYENQITYTATGSF